MVTNIKTVTVQDILCDGYKWFSGILDLCLEPTHRTHPAAQKKGKVVAFCGYLGEEGSGGKTTTKSDLHGSRGMFANGIGFLGILEKGSADSDKGEAKGRQHARLAARYMEQLAPEYPPGLSISGCSDTDTSDLDLNANRDYHAAFAEDLKKLTPWRARTYGDLETAEVVPLTRICTLPGASGWSKRWFKAISGIARADRGNANLILTATRAARLRDIDMLQQLDKPTGAYVDWLFPYLNNRIQFWLPGADDPLIDLEDPEGPSRPTHPPTTMTPTEAIVNELPTVSYGSTGYHVKVVQELLQLNGYYLGYAVDGLNGNKTTQAVKDFQEAKGLKPDGKVGRKETWPALLGI